MMMMIKEVAWCKGNSQWHIIVGASLFQEYTHMNTDGIISLKSRVILLKREFLSEREMNEKPQSHVEGKLHALLLFNPFSKNT